MRALIAMATILVLGCHAAHQSDKPVPTPVLARSYNQSPVDIYLLCGDHEAEWLGTLPEKASNDFEIRPERRRCATGLNFFLYVRNFGRGYWVGPVKPDMYESVYLVVEKYAGLSSAEIIDDR